MCFRGLISPLIINHTSHDVIPIILVVIIMFVLVLQASYIKMSDIIGYVAIAIAAVAIIVSIILSIIVCLLYRKIKRLGQYCYSIVIVLLQYCYSIVILLMIVLVLSITTWSYHSLAISSVVISQQQSSHQSILAICPLAILPLVILSLCHYLVYMLAFLPYQSSCHQSILAIFVVNCCLHDVLIPSFLPGIVNHSNNITAIVRACMQ